MNTRLPFYSATIIFALLCIVTGPRTARAQEPGLWSMTYTGGADNAGTIFRTKPDGTAISVAHSFTIVNSGSRPYVNAQLVQLSNGKMYGVTSSRGVNNGGVLFEYDPATGVYTKKFDFATATGREPHGALALANNGKLYGLTSGGGANNVGVIYEYDPAANSYAKKIDLTAANGSVPYGNSLYLHSNGKFYGMTVSGGSSNFGVLFEYDPDTNTYTKKIDFNGTANGANPYGRLMVTSTGKVFGVTSQGGASNQGIVFEYSPSTNTLTKRADFSSSKGANPFDGLVEGNNNLLYGVAAVNGSLFEFNPSTNALTKKVDFNLSSPDNGTFPYGTLVKSANGKLYGMTSSGGSFNHGVLFEYDVSTNTFSKKINLEEPNGSSPYGSLMLASNGSFYGMTYQGGATYQGVLFEYNPSTNVFNKKIDFETMPNGGYPLGGLMRASNNKLYGMTNIGGANDGGVIFELDPVTNTFTKKHDFSRATGAYPQGNLTQAPNNKLYGMAEAGGGANDAGVIFEFDLATNTYAKKYEFDETNGSEPVGSLTLGTNNKFYGTTSEGGASGYGVIFEYDPATNVYAKKVEFDSYTVGFNPYDALVQATNGKFYGLCRDGGLSSGLGMGTLFEYDLATNTITKKVSFIGATGETPEGSVVQAPNGKLYGVTRYGGAHSRGVLFEYDITTSTYTKRFDFGATSTALAEPTASLALSSNGKVYGGTLYGGTNDKGGIFEFDPTTGTITKKSDFTGSNGGALLYGRLLFVNCVKPATPTITISNENTATPILTSSSSINNQWYRNGAAIAGATGSTLSISQPGSYTVETVGVGCNSEMSDDFVIVITGISESTGSSKTLYPNPVVDFLHITIDNHNGGAVVSITDVNGKVLQSAVASTDLMQIDVTSLPTGLYLATIKSNKSIKTIRFIKK